MKPNISGLHHVTAIAGAPQRNLDFYAGVLGLRLVKRTVNFDDPGTYHFYFGDATGTPGTILTFFPWAGAFRGRQGTGQVEATAFSIPAESLGYWLERLKSHGVTIGQPAKRFGEEVVRFADPDGLLLELVASHPSGNVKPWTDGTVPPEHSLRGFHSVTGALDDAGNTAKLLTEVFGYQFAGEEGGRQRFQAAGSRDPGRLIDLLTLGGADRATGGVGSVHHIAFRASDDKEQLEWRERLIGLGYHVSPVMDRTYFHSIYFREPGGILFEIATDPPGFLLDEAQEELGHNLKLPLDVEQVRGQIEAVLAPITIPTKETFA
jgi:glyoxalase family protein